jgi:ribonuclease P protein component
VDFQAVFDGAAFKVGDAHFLFLARANTLGHCRLGLVIAKKKVRRAVDRNRIKRLIRDHFRLCQDQLPAVDIVFLARQNLALLPPADFRSGLDQAWKRLQRKLESPEPMDSRAKP